MSGSRDKSITTKLAAGTVAVALGFGLVAAQPVVAQDTDQEPSASSDQHHGRRWAERRAERRAALAAELGITSDELDAAARAAHDQVVADLGPTERPVDPDELSARLDAFNEAMAAELGITVEELRAARRQVLADELAEAVEAGHLTQEEADEMLAAFDDGTLPELIRERRLERGKVFGGQRRFGPGAPAQEGDD